MNNNNKRMESLIVIMVWQHLPN